MQRFPDYLSSQAGYAALTSVLVIAAVVLTIGSTVALLSVNDIQSALSNKKSDETLDFVEGCVEDALLRLAEDDSIPTTLTNPEGTCSVTINSQAGDDWTFTVTGTSDISTKSVQVEANRASTVSITSWLEV